MLQRRETGWTREATGEVSVAIGIMCGSIEKHDCGIVTRPGKRRDGLDGLSECHLAYSRTALSKAGTTCG